MSLNISVLQLDFVFLQICICETASVRQLKQSFIALTYSQLCICETALVRQLKHVSLRSRFTIFVSFFGFSTDLCTFARKFQELAPF